MKKTYKIEVDCANCANKMEDAIRKIKGIKDVSINFLTMKLKVEYEDNVDIEKINKEIFSICKKVEPDCELDLN